MRQCIHMGRAVSLQKCYVMWQFSISWLFIFLILLRNWWNVLICHDEIRLPVSWRHLMGPEMCRRLKLFPLQISTVLGLYWIGSWSLVMLLHFMRWWVDGIGLSIWVIRVGKFVNWIYFFLISWTKLSFWFSTLYFFQFTFWTEFSEIFWILFGDPCISFLFLFFFMHVILDNWASQNF